MLYPSFALACGQSLPPSTTGAACTLQRQSWPLDALRTFSLRMAMHGLSVSTTLMQGDPRYALEQLRQAQALPDEPLRDLACGLIGALEQRCTDLRCGA